MFQYIALLDSLIFAIAMSCLSTLEKLALASCVMRYGESDWQTIVKQMNSIVRDKSVHFSSKICAREYSRLTETVNVPKRRRTEGGTAEPVAGQLVSRLTLAHIDHLKRAVETDRVEIQTLKRQLAELEAKKAAALNSPKTNATSDEKLKAEVEETPLDVEPKEIETVTITTPNETAVKSDETRSKVKEKDEVEVNKRSKVTEKDEIEVNKRSKVTEKDEIEVNKRVKVTEKDEVEVSKRVKVTEKDEVEVKKRSKVTEKDEVEVSKRSKVTEKDEVEVSKRSKVKDKDEVEVKDKEPPQTPQPESPVVFPSPSSSKVDTPSPGREPIILKISTKKQQPEQQLTKTVEQQSRAPTQQQQQSIPNKAKEETPTAKSKATPPKSGGRASRRHLAMTDFPSNFPSADAYRLWKRQIMMVWRTTAGHRHANVFAHPVTEDIAPGYHQIVYRPTDLSTIKKSVESGGITTTAEFQRQLLLMFVNAVMYNNADHDVHKMALEMSLDVMRHMNELLPAEGASPLHPIQIPESLQLIVSKSVGYVTATTGQEKSLRSRSARVSTAARPPPTGGGPRRTPTPSRGVPPPQDGVSNSSDGVGFFYRFWFGQSEIRDDGPGEVPSQPVRKGLLNRGAAPSRWWWPEEDTHAIP